MEKKIITLSEIINQSVSRANRWHNGNFTNWSLTDWSTAFAGEAGEVCNAVKKYRRLEDEITSINEGDRHVTDKQQAKKKIAHEMADTFLYMVLLAAYLGIDLAPAIIETFNKKSDEYGFPERLEPQNAIVDDVESTIYVQAVRGNV